MATTKSFDRTVPFLRRRTTTGTVTVPILTVTLIRPGRTRVGLPLLFDTGASVTTLRKELYHLFGVSRWDAGQPVEMATAGGSDPVRAYRYSARLEVLGKTLDCPVQLANLPINPLYVGLLGREGIFHEFGFGFWEGPGELLAALTP